MGAAAALTTPCGVSAGCIIRGAAVGFGFGGMSARDEEGLGVSLLGEWRARGKAAHRVQRALGGRPGQAPMYPLANARPESKVFEALESALRRSA